ncbi:MAG: DUF4412 domain-containing protein [Bacteroidales bacterium]|nr:DUF4412 domain-containing protein [Bacteroidales bacterium]
MKARSLLLLLAFLVVAPNTSNAQFGALKKAINKQIDNKLDSTIHKGAKDNAQEQTGQVQSDKVPTGDNRGTRETNRGLFGGKINIKYNDEYQFTGRIYMQMETYDKKDIIKSDYYTYYNGNTLDAGIEVKLVDNEGKKGQETLPSVFLFDNDNRCFMILINGESKTGIISTIPSDSAIAAQAKNQKLANPDNASVTKTGNSRTIAGYRCDEYKIVEPDKDGYSTVWMTKDVKIKANKKNWGKSGMPTYYNYPGFEDAMMLAAESFDKNNKPEMKMETKEINDNFSHTISTAGYTFMKMNFGQAGKK